MIIDTIENLVRYKGLSPNIDQAIDYIRATDLNEMPLGHTAVSGECVHFNHFQYMTVEKAEDSLFEAHKKYLDLHVILSGQEFVAVAPIEALEHVEERPDEDSVMYRGEAAFRFPITTGQFVLLYPGEGHLPRLSINGVNTDVNKVVFKIQVQDHCADSAWHSAAVSEEGKAYMRNMLPEG